MHGMRDGPASGVHGAEPVGVAGQFELFKPHAIRDRNEPPVCARRGVTLCNPNGDHQLSERESCAGFHGLLCQVEFRGHERKPTVLRDQFSGADHFGDYDGTQVGLSDPERGQAAGFFDPFDYLIASAGLGSEVSLFHLAGRVHSGQDFGGPRDKFFGALGPLVPTLDVAPVAGMEAAFVITGVPKRLFADVVIVPSCSLSCVTCQYRFHLSERVWQRGPVPSLPWPRGPPVSSASDCGSCGSQGSKTE